MKKKIIVTSVILTAIIVFLYGFYNYTKKKAIQKSEAENGNKGGKTNDNGGKEINLSEVQRQKPKEIIK